MARKLIAQGAGRISCADAKVSRYLMRSDGYDIPLAGFADVSCILRPKGRIIAPAIVAFEMVAHSVTGARFVGAAVSQELQVRVTV
jgi:hypothetical protein